MSTYMYLGCERHKEYAWLVSFNLGSERLAPDSETVVPAFVFAHMGCSLSVYCEGTPALDDWESWEPENLESLKSRDRPEAEPTPEFLVSDLT